MTRAGQMQDFGRSGLILLAFDNDQRVSFINGAAQALYRVDASVVGRPGSALFTYGWLDPADEAEAHAALEAGQTWTGQVMQRLHDGRQLRVELHASATYDTHGQRSGTLGLLRDITALHQDARLMQLMIAHLGDVVALHTPDGKIISTNRPAVSPQGSALPEVRGLSSYDLIHPDDREHVQRDLHGPVLRGEEGRAEWRRVEAGRPVAWMETRAAPLLGPGGHLQYILTITRDVSGRRAQEERLRLLESAMAHAGDAIAVVRVGTAGALEVLYVNRAFTRMTGYDADEVTGPARHLLTGAADDPELSLRIGTRLRAGLEVDETFRSRSKDGRRFWAHLSMTPIADHGHPHWMAVIRDVTEAQRRTLLERDRRAVLELATANRPLPEVMAALLALIERQHPGVASVDWLRAGVLVSGAATRLPAAFVQGMSGHPPDEHGGSSRAAALGRPVVAADIRTDRHWAGPRELALEHGLQACWSVPVYSDHRAVLGTLSVYLSHPGAASDGDLEQLEDAARLAAVIFERYRAQDETLHLAQHDPLTGLPNRALFAELLQRAAATLPAGQLLAVGLVDLDRFKMVNDTHGHAAGDDLLRLVAQRLTGVLGGRGTVARMGGDEFTLIAPLEDHAALGTLAQDVLTTFDRPFEVAGHTLHIQGSLGVALYPADARTGGELLRLADLAMYGAKRQHLGWARSHAHGPAAGASALEVSLRRAVSGRELGVDYQPQIGVASGQPVGLDARLRWDSADFGPLDVAALLAASEDTDLVLRVGRWMLQQVCRDAAALQGDHPGLRAAVGVPVRLFGHPAFPGLLTGILRGAALHPALLTVELGKGALVGAAETAQLRRVRGVGVQIGMDALGTTFQTLGTLRTLPIQMLRVGGPSAGAAALEPLGLDARLIRSVAHLAQALHATLAIEDVDTETQAGILRDLGAEVLQGPLYSGPLALDALHAWLAAHPAP